MLTPEIVLLIHKTFTYLNGRYVAPDGTVTQLLATRPDLRTAARVIDSAALAGDVQAVRGACRGCIAAWKRALAEGGKV